MQDTIKQGVEKVDEGKDAVVHGVQNASDWVGNHTIGGCTTATAGAGLYASVNICVVWSNGKPAVTVTPAFGLSLPTLSLTGGLLVSNAQCSDDLGKWFNTFGAGVGAGPAVSDDYSYGTNSKGQDIWSNQTNVGVGADFPLDLHAGKSFTWVFGLG